MRISVSLSALAAAALTSIALVVPAAHADQKWTGELTDADPSMTVNLPNSGTDTCDPSGLEVTTPVDKVTFTSTTDGPRRFVVRATGIVSPAFWVYVNGVCVAGDDGGDDQAEDTALTADVEAVQIAKGANVEVRITGPFQPMPWTLEVLQPGSANAAATGNATKYVGLPEQVTCATGSATATLTKAAKKAAKKGKIKKIIFTAGGAKVATVKAKKIKKAVKNGVALAGIPKTATSIDVKVKLTKGKKKTASRAYSAC